MSRRDDGIYVEIAIRAGIETIWRYTQDPALHERWDLRFSTIRYLPRASDSEPQRFLYTTRIGFGMGIAGEGESMGSREDATGARTSALKFWSGDFKSLIREGSGYWRYLPGAEAGEGVCGSLPYVRGSVSGRGSVADGGPVSGRGSVSGRGPVSDGGSVADGEGATRFLTWYDYRTRFGMAGRVVDKLLFRPLIGWATAWSFDRLRLWVDEGIAPEASLRFAGVHAAARAAIAFTWIWQGLVPKLIHADAAERAMLAAAGLPDSLLPVVGGVEIALGVLTLGLWNWPPVFLINGAAMLAALAAVAVNSPAYLFTAFNAVTLNCGMTMLSAVGYLASAQMPSAGRCRRRPREDSR